MAPQLARRLLYAIAAICVISTAGIALVRPAPAPRAAQAQPLLPIAGPSSVIYSSNGKSPSIIYALNGNSESFSLQKLCAASNSACAKVVFRSAPP